MSFVRGCPQSQLFPTFIPNHIRIGDTLTTKFRKIQTFTQKGVPIRHLFCYGFPFQGMFGPFMMGDDHGEFGHEKPAHSVKLDRISIWGNLPVTQEVWAAVYPDQKNPAYFQGAKRPVEQVSYHDAIDLGFSQA